MSETLKDPDMKEIIIDFCDESDGFLKQLEELLEKFEDTREGSLLEEFGQIIDRIMGAAKSIEAVHMGTYCELGKTIAYKASQASEKYLLDVVVAVLFDTIEILVSVSKNIRSIQEETVKGINLETFATRLQWLATKFKDIKRASVKFGNDDNQLTDQKSIDQLLADLGL